MTQEVVADLKEVKKIRRSKSFWVCPLKVCEHAHSRTVLVDLVHCSHLWRRRLFCLKLRTTTWLHSSCFLWTCLQVTAVNSWITWHAFRLELGYLVKADGSQILSRSSCSSQVYCHCCIGYITTERECCTRKLQCVLLWFGAVYFFFFHKITLTSNGHFYKVMKTNMNLLIPKAITMWLFYVLLYF